MEMLSIRELTGRIHFINVETIRKIDINSTTGNHTIIIYYINEKFTSESYIVSSQEQARIEKIMFGENTSLAATQ